ncbi:MAG: Wzz/FepE/Etk N-terminal domain-containing protein [Armatimonadota bacterium]|nr:Wzz/FepE/Etk N-terminal domain-containing protein [Armatimonadota bacterium]MCX7778265.1 Wzz/FepE/Etk N-terminal domain-containing protein [Armatimonadota bacterium]MDW8026294.1 Wzz/FepE/Etk N-terminal domain-containing protein [Armatimonadota bacterium]
MKTMVEERQDEEEVDLFEVVGILWNARKFIILATIGGIFLSGFIAACLMPRTYSATASVLMPVAPTPQLQSLLGALAAQADLAGGFITQPKAELYRAVLESRRIRERVIRKTGLMDYFNVNIIDDAIEELSKATKISVKDPTVKVSVKLVGTPRFPLWRPKHPRGFEYGENDGRVKQLVARVANEYVEALSDFLKTTKVARSRVYREFIEQRLKEVKHAYEHIPIVPNLPTPMAAALLDGSVARLVDRYAQLSVEVTKAEAEANATIAQLERLSKLLDLQVKQGLTPVLERLKERLQQEEFAYASLRLKYGEEHPLVREQKGRVAEARQQLDKEIQRWSESAKEQIAPGLAELQAQYVAASARANALQRMLKQTENELNSLTLSMDKWRRKRVEFEIAENAYKLLMDQLLRAQMAERYEGIEVEVLDRAVPPYKHTTPSIKLAIVIGGFLALILSVFISLATHSVRMRMLRLTQPSMQSQQDSGFGR